MFECVVVLICIIVLGLFLYSFFFVLSFWMQVMLFSCVILICLLFKLFSLTKNENIQKAIGYFAGVVVVFGLIAYTACIFYQLGIQEIVRSDLF